VPRTGSAPRELNAGGRGPSGVWRAVRRGPDAGDAGRPGARPRGPRSRRARPAAA
jgi:hypothetical protein